MVEVNYLNIDGDIETTPVGYNNLLSKESTVTNSTDANNDATGILDLSSGINNGNSDAILGQGSINYNQTTLRTLQVRQNIQSANYVEGVSGWIIKGNGNAEFQTLLASEFVKVFSQATEPTTGMSEGDFWYDTDDSNKRYVYRSSAWVVDTGITNWSTIVDDDGNKPDNNADVTYSNFYKVYEDCVFIGNKNDGLTENVDANGALTRNFAFTPMNSYGGADVTLYTSTGITTGTVGNYGWEYWTEIEFMAKVILSSNKASDIHDAFWGLMSDDYVFTQVETNAASTLRHIGFAYVNQVYRVYSADGSTQGYTNLTGVGSGLNTFRFRYFPASAQVLVYLNGTYKFTRTAYLPMGTDELFCLYFGIKSDEAQQADRLNFDLLNNYYVRLIK
jgi:hypothetical protein